MTKQNKINVALLTIILVVAGFISSCEGPQGPAGKDGADGTDGTAVCGTCHGAGEPLWDKVAEYSYSGHANGESWGRGSSGSCAPCHSGQAFKQTVTGQTVTAPEYPTPVNCISCHNIHDQYTSDDLLPITTAAVTFNGDYTNGATFDKGTGNLCVNCHQSRKRGYFDTPGDIKISSSHFGPHHGTQGNVLAGNGLYNEFPGFSANNSFHTANVANSCVTCHMSNTNHAFEPKLAACNEAGCHNGLEDFDYKSVQTDVQALMDELRDALAAKGYIEEEDGEWHPHVTTDPIPRDHAGAVFNYFGLLDDGSLGVHNTGYTKAILNASIAAVQ